MAVHQNTLTSSTNTSLVFSVTDQGDEEDLTSSCQPEFVDVSPELVSLSVRDGFLSQQGQAKTIIYFRRIYRAFQSIMKLQRENALQQKGMFADTMQVLLLVSIVRHWPICGLPLPLFSRVPIPVFS
jgi:hypothetical protein